MHRELPHNPDKMRTGVVARLMVIVAVTVALVMSLAPTARADELDDRREQLDQELVHQQGVVEHHSQELQGAIAALDQAEQELSAAEAELAEAEAATLEAMELEAQRIAEFEQAERDLSLAEAHVAAAVAAWESVDRRTTEEITVITQQSGPLVDLALLFTDVRMSNLNQRAQLSTTLLDSSSLELDELQSRRFAMENAQQEAEEARVRAEEAREAAEAQRVAKEEAEQEAAELRDSVQALVVQRDQARVAAENSLADEQARQAQLEAESADVDARIQERIRLEEERRIREEQERLAREQAERDRLAREQEAREQAARDQAARDQAARERAASQPAAPAQAQRQQQTSRSQERPAATPPRQQSSSSSSSSRFLRPVSGRLTSPYGPRVHPILGVRKLHDGTDFAGACGSPIKAAADGRVAERYYNNAYGWRLMIDHGRVDGSYVTTGYNHATRYVVSPGQRVSRGQTIGYVGTTGYSTGCHLHLMVWQNGKLTNPMSKWFR